MPFTLPNDLIVTHPGPGPDIQTITHLLFDHT